MLVLPFPMPAKKEPVRGEFAAVYSPNGLRQRPTALVQRPARTPQQVAFYPGPEALPWGEDSAASTSTSTPSGFQAYVPTLVQAAGAYVESTDSRVYEQKIRNYQKMRETPPYNIVPGTLWYDNEIAKMRAKLITAREKEQVTREWRVLGQTAAGVSILAGIAAVTLIVVATAQVAKRR